MATEGDVNAASTTNVHSDGGKKNLKGKKHQKGSEEMLLDPTLSKELTSHPPSTTETSDDDRGEEPIDVTPGEEWIARVEMPDVSLSRAGKDENACWQVLFRCYCSEEDVGGPGFLRYLYARQQKKTRGA
ncbi:hypothetical protein H5410_028877 [Solanum commersonii]|uniref:Uncharacterized protein n=1 Tax=Solanum commersonii TaxID=4109 RepID=A0A9J5Z3D9_SOLCO|nr:hypothetical protein H5410_028877 [Solanum commersonii]